MSDTNIGFIFSLIYFVYTFNLAVILNHIIRFYKAAYKTNFLKDI